MKHSIDAARARRLAVEADCDPRTIFKALRGGQIRNGATKRRIFAVLEKAGLKTLDEDERHAQTARSMSVLP